MEHFLFTQLKFVRSQTLKLMDGITEETADRIPDGFRNSIRWQLGHIYVVLERFAFQYIGLPLNRPDGFKELFEFGSSPLNWPEGAAVPTLEELKGLLASQLGRIEEALTVRLREKVPQPYTTSSGITLGSPEEFLSMNLYHEGMHLSVIKLYKVLLARS
ncbi:DinB family protein [Paenibacillus montanisoli]|uniref:DinB family protein n=1 Tax=Paenibacillus montanisoli TaxID=2081970 RepID=A0A328U117_9BACL|nr:DinB family protein [Paenibacillus montanisoli]RAP73696.1 DinB family protein [Paenibacillus montanisoli]